MINSKISSAVLIDGGFLLKRYTYLVPESRKYTPKKFADILYKYVLEHLKRNND